MLIILAVLMVANAVLRSICHRYRYRPEKLARDRKLLNLALEGRLAQYRHF